MSSLLPVACLLLGIALPVGLFWAVVRRAWRQLAVAEAYRDVAQHLGLERDFRGVSVQGHLGDRRIYVGEVLEGHGKGRRVATRGVLRFERPLGLGLLLRRRASTAWILGRRKAHVRTGDEDFDKAVEISGDDAERITALVDPDVRTAVLDLLRRWPDLLVTDHHVRVRLKRPEASALGLTALVNGMQRLADALLAARESVPAPDEVADLAAEWSGLAEDLGLTLVPSWPLLTGTLSGRRVLLCVRRSAQGFRAVLHCWLAEAHDMGLILHPQVEPDGYWSVGQDIQIDDEDFDDAFVIKGYDPERVRQTLTPTARRELQALLALGAVEVDDRMVRVRRLPLDADTLREALTRVAAAALALEPRELAA